MSKKDEDMKVFVDMIREVHRRGGAVCIFTEEELRGVDAEDVEDLMCSSGNDLIALKSPLADTEDEDGEEGEEQ